jgi:hypothetical protein
MSEEISSVMALRSNCKYQRPNASGIKINKSMRVIYVDFLKEVSNLPLNSQQGHLPILLTMFNTKHVVILARWCVSKIIIIFFLCALLTVLAQITHHIDWDLTCNDELH